MFRSVVGWGLVAVFIGMSGCRMCQHPFDYCGPVFDSGRQPCSMQSRAGSILDGITETPPSQVEEHQEPAFMANEMRPGDVPGSERIVSVTDRAVDPAVEEDDSSQTADLASPTSSSSSAGWTARRSSTNLDR